MKTNLLIIKHASVVIIRLFIYMSNLYAPYLYIG